MNVEWEKFTKYRFLKIQIQPISATGKCGWALCWCRLLEWWFCLSSSRDKTCFSAHCLPQLVSRGSSYAILLKILPLPVIYFLNKCGLLTHFSPFLRASTQSLAEALRQLPASPELQAVLSYIFPTYGVYWPWVAPGRGGAALLA